MELLTADADVARHVLRTAPETELGGRVTGVCLRARTVAAGAPCNSQTDPCPEVWKRSGMDAVCSSALCPADVSCFRVLLLLLLLLLLLGDASGHFDGAGQQVSGAAAALRR